MTQQIGHGFETLEDRTLLTANVTATLVGGTLTITGDATANDIAVSGTGSQGGIDVFLANSQTLKLNGGSTVSSAEGTFTGVTNIVINGSGGNDFVGLKDVNIKGNLTEFQGSGNDQTYLYDLNVGGNVTAFGGSGDDYNNMYGLTAGGSLTFLGGTGNNSELAAGDLKISGSVLATQGTGTGEGIYVYNMDVGGSVTAIDGGGANDYVSLDAYTTEFSSYIGGSVTLSAGLGANTKDEVYVDDGASLAIHGSVSLFATNNYVESNGYGSHLSIGGNVAMNVHSLSGGTGYGVVSSYGTSTVNIGGSVLISGGAGNDQLGLSAHASAYGFGVNQVTHGITVAGSVVISGNGGNDTIGIQAVGQQASYGTLSTQFAFGFNSESIAIGGSVLLNGDGVGNDEIGVRAYGSQVNIAGSLTMLGGIGNDRMGAAAFGETGAGLDPLAIPGQVTVGQTLAVVGGTGTNEIGSQNLTVGGITTMVAGHADFALNDTTFGGNVLLEGLASNDYFDLEDDVFDKNLTVIGGGSNDILYFPGDNQVHGTKTFINVRQGEIV